MANCANCSDAAVYAYAPIRGSQTLFCERHFPSFAKKPEFAEVVIELAAQPVVEEVVEEALIEEVPAAPKPKPSKKSATADEAPVEAPAEDVPAEEAN